MRILCRVLLTLSGLVLLVGSAGLGGDAAPPAPAELPPAPPAPPAAETQPLPPMPVELPPRPPSPVTAFRKLLRAAPEERAKNLAGRSEAQRAYLEAQLREFDALSRAEQEARLRLMELQWYLSPLLTTPPEKRPKFLGTVPPAYRAAVRDRLAAWDALSSDEQTSLLDDRAVAARLCAQPVGGSAAPGNATNQASLAPELRAQTRRSVARWRGMSAEQQRRRVEELGRFFQFSEAQKERTLAEIAKASRPQTAGLISRLDQLPPEERARCLAALQRYAALPPAERERFLRNAARWAAMSPEERRRWRQLQAMLPPMPVELPPRPPLVRAGANPPTPR